jgi:hypothetical protein
LGPLKENWEKRFAGTIGTRSQLTGCEIDMLPEYLYWCAIEDALKIIKATPPNSFMRLILEMDQEVEENLGRCVRLLSASLSPAELFRLEMIVAQKRAETAG